MNFKEIKDGLILDRLAEKYQKPHIKEINNSVNPIKTSIFQNNPKM